MLRPGLIALLCAFTGAACIMAGGAAAGAATTPSVVPGPRVVLAFLPARERPPKVPPTVKTPPQPTQVLLKRLDRRKSLSLGVLGATQGPYTPEQFLLDITQGSRTSAATYDTKNPWPMRLVQAGISGYIDGWLPNKRRALNAPASTVPGLLASSIKGVGGGATYVGFSEPRNFEAAAAADRAGTVRRVSIGPAATVFTRTQELLARHKFIVVSLPPSRRGGQQLDQLIGQRPSNELLIVVQAPPPDKPPQALPIGMAGEGKKPGGLTSQSTRQNGIVAAIDLAPTVLDWLHVKVPSDVRGEPIEVRGSRNAKRLDDLRDRFTNIGKYRLTAVQGMVLIFLGVLLAMGCFGGWHTRFRKALRVGTLAFMWGPLIVLFEAFFNPGTPGVEMAIVAIPSFALAFLTDRFVKWPRGPMVPIFLALIAYTVDLANDSHLIVRSLLGPNPKFGSRFFGVGNELEAALPVLLFIGLAAALSGRARSRGLAATFAGAGALLAVIVGSGRLGADVGGVITIGTGTVVATLMLLPERPSRKVMALAALTPVLAVGALALLDIATGGNSHFTRNVLNQSGGNFGDTLLRRLELAYNALFNGRRMPYVVAAGAIAVGFAYRNRSWLYRPLNEPVWQAALVGGLVSCIAGSFANDSGPLLFVVGMFGLVVATGYIQGDPRLSATDAPSGE
ncbi:MAG: hypothetical protein QOK04_1447, partial [Solirubrobacteraceae bacterium]|nr:hypothetical protein [Solirubrobacteraceae bacterium]